MMTLDDQLSIANQILRCHKAAKELFGDGFQETVQPGVEVLQHIMKATGRPCLSIAIELAGQTDDASQVMLIMAAAYEVIIRKPVEQFEVI